MGCLWARHPASSRRPMANGAVLLAMSTYGVSHALRYRTDLMTMRPDAPSPWAERPGVQARKWFPASVGAVRDARRFVESHVPDPGLSHWAALLVGELAANAVVHARSCFQVGIEGNESYRIEVTDLSREQPSKRDLTEGATGGRGLGIVEAVSSSWGSGEVPLGKVVWFELDGAGRSEGRGSNTQSRDRSA